MRHKHKHYRDDDDNPFDRNGLLKDGRSAKFRMTMMDWYWSFTERR